jgi:hypothetical protein
MYSQDAIVNLGSFFNWAKILMQYVHAWDQESLSLITLYKSSELIWKALEVINLTVRGKFQAILHRSTLQSPNL